MLPVEISVERVIEKHAADVEKSRTDAQPEKSRPIAATAEKPARQTIRPNRWKVGSAPQNEQGPQIVWLLA